MAKATTLDPTKDRLLSEEELALRWGVKRRLLRYWRERGIFPGISLYGRTVRYRLSDVVKVEEREVVLALPRQAIPTSTRPRKKREARS